MNKAASGPTGGIADQTLGVLLRFDPAKRRPPVRFKLHRKLGRSGRLSVVAQQRDEQSGGIGCSVVAPKGHVVAARQLAHPNLMRYLARLFGPDIIIDLTLVAGQKVQRAGRDLWRGG